MNRVFWCELKRLSSSITFLGSFLLSIGFFLANAMNEEMTRNGIDVIYRSGDTIAGLMPFVAILLALGMIQIYSAGGISEYIYSGVRRTKLYLSQFFALSLICICSFVFAEFLTVIFVSLTRDGLGSQDSSVLFEYSIRAVIGIITYSAFYVSYLCVILTVLPNTIALPVQYFVFYVISLILSGMITKLKWLPEKWLPDILPSKAMGLSTYPNVSLQHSLWDFLYLAGWSVVLLIMGSLFFRKKEIRY